MTHLGGPRDAGLARGLRESGDRGPLRGRDEQHDEERDGRDELWAQCVAQALVAELPRARPLPAAPSPGGDDGAVESEVTGETGGAQAAAWDRAAARSAQDGAATSAAGGSARHGQHAGRSDDAGRSDAQRSDGIPAELCTEVSDERLGRLRLSVARGARGLDIVINVADSHVKALIEADQAILMKTLKEAGLSVASLQIGSAARAGTALAQDREGSEKARPSASFRQPGSRWRAYHSSPEPEDADGEGVDLTA